MNISHLYLALFVLCVSIGYKKLKVHAAKCYEIGPCVHGSEDVSLYREGFVFVSVGLQMEANENEVEFGSIMGIQIINENDGVEIQYQNLTIEANKMPKYFRPHGMFIANASIDDDSLDDTTRDRLFVISHESMYNDNEQVNEESIFVFDIVPQNGNNETSLNWPTLELKYKLKSSIFPKQWFLNDLVVLPKLSNQESYELFVTQCWGIVDESMTNPRCGEKWIYHCTWLESSNYTDSEGVNSIDMDCSKAISRSTNGCYNGIALSPDASQLWINDIRSRILVAYDISTSISNEGGNRENVNESLRLSADFASEKEIDKTMQEPKLIRTLIRKEENDMKLGVPLTRVDNIEFDYSSGNIIMADMVWGWVVSVPILDLNAQTTFMNIDAITIAPLSDPSPSVAVYTKGVSVVGFRDKGPVLYCVGQPKLSLYTIPITWI